MPNNLIFRDALNELDDKRIKQIKPLIPPQILMEDSPLTLQAAQSVIIGRANAEKIIKGQDDRMLVIVGPCSVHDVKAAIEYAGRLKSYASEANDELFIIMRVYFEKPRTTVGWKGLINDPHLNNSFQINKGLRIARNLLLEINQMGVPCGCEFLDTITPQYLADLVSWGAIGARTTESQVHRELASGLSVPVGFKNGTDGNIGIAVDAIKAAGSGHHFLSVTKQGLSAIVATDGNDCCHVILRGGAKGPNYSAENVQEVAQKLEAAKLPARIMIDCSHGNSQKLFSKQVEVAKDIAEQLKSSPTGQHILGVMIESHLKEGRQNLPVEGPFNLAYGQSITDGCISWETTIQVLDTLREGVRARRMNFSDIIKEILVEKAQEDSNDPLSWASLCKELLQEKDQTEERFDEITLHLLDCITILNVNNKQNNSRFCKGILERPFYLAFVEMLGKCFENDGFPTHLKTSRLFMLENKNLSRLEQIENEMKRAKLPPISSSQFNELHKKILQEFLFTFLNPKDLNTFLGLRTTIGSSTQLPPSLNECLNSFTTHYVKRNAKTLREGLVIKISLTVGAKALSKHFHRDVSNSFWGNCSGTNRVLAKILTDVAWINLHSMVHDTRVFEIRNSEGYGARWEIQGPNTQQLSSQQPQLDTPSSNTNDNKQRVMFRGFLEPQMKDGHIKGWVH
ncbi:689_t:CDS:10 [Funneliformis geosporum]|nr:689_t:CDS:10 [Funneliformis geosporum]